MKKKTKLEIQLRDEITELVLENQGLKNDFKLMKNKKEHYESLYHSYYGITKSMFRTNDQMMILIPIGVIIALIVIFAVILKLKGWI